MSIEESFNKLTQSDVPNDIVLLLGSVKNSKIEYRKLKITKNLQEEFQQIINNILTRKNEKFNIGDLKIIDYDPGNNIDKFNNIEYIEFPEISYLSDFIGTIPDNMNVNLFDSKDEIFLKNLRFYIFYYKTNCENVLCFQAVRNMKQLMKGNKFIAYLFDDIYDKSIDPSFMFEKTIDCIVYNNSIYIFNKQKFHQIFSFYSELKIKAQKTLIDCKLNQFVDNFEEFSELCMKIPFMYIKLASMGTKDYLKQVKIADLINVINVYNLDIEIVQNNGDTKLKFDQKQKWEILRLFDDGYLKSEMTDNKYAVNSKLRLKIK